MSELDINNLQGTATWDRTQEVNPFQELANAVIAQAAKDYFNIAAGFKITPPLAAWEPSPSLREIERFFRSDYFDVITDIDPECLLRRLKAEAKKAKKLKIVYTVSRQADGGRYYVHKVGETEQLSVLCKRKRDALRKAAELQGIDHALYMKVRERDLVE